MLKHIIFTVASILVFALGASAQADDWLPPRVHHTLKLGNMQLHLTEKARKDIQADVDALYRSPKFFKLKVEKVDMYMPVIEPILAQYNVPNEFKYLVIQESGLVPDAVSSSNAVGYWQFKETSATELGMRVDRQIDDRMNIVASTEGAMKYLLRSNEVFDNWVYSLLSYNVGLGGATRSLDDRYYGAKQLKIDHNTHWYVKKFLSHLVAFEPVLDKLPRQVMLYQYKNTEGKNLRQIANEFDLPIEDIDAYNKWLKANRIPDDKEYVAIIPLKLEESEELNLQEEKVVVSQAKKQALEELQFGRMQSAPETIEDNPEGERVFKLINGVRATVARTGDKITSLAKAGDISVYLFTKYNEISPATKIQPGQLYYFGRKKSKATTYKHTTLPGQTIWQVAQQYGIREKKLRQKNRMDKTEEPKTGQILWLRYFRPRDEPVAFDNEVKEKAISQVSNSGNTETTVMEKQPDAKAPVQNKTEIKKPVLPNTQKVEVAKSSPAKTAEPDTLLARPEKQAAEGNDQLQEEIVEEDSEVKVQQLYPKASEGTRNIQDENEEKQPGDSLSYYSEEKAAFELEKPVEFVEDNTLTERNIEADLNDGPVFSMSEAASPQPEPEFHTVAKGETLYSIGRMYKISVQDIKRINSMGEEESLAIGQKIRIKATMPEEAVIAEPEQKEAAATIYHTVAEGETMYRVARRYNVTIKDIMEWNNRSDFNIKPGEKLLVKQTK